MSKKQSNNDKADDLINIIKNHDSDGDGCLTQEEAGRALQVLGKNTSKQELAELCSKLSNPNKINADDLGKIFGQLAISSMFGAPVDAFKRNK